VSAAELNAHLHHRFAQRHIGTNLEYLIPSLADCERSLAQPGQIVPGRWRKETKTGSVDALPVGTDQGHLKAQSLTQNRLTAQFTEADSRSLPGNQQGQQENCSSAHDAIQRSHL